MLSVNPAGTHQVQKLEKSYISLRNIRYLLLFHCLIIYSEVLDPDLIFLALNTYVWLGCMQSELPASSETVI